MNDPIDTYIRQIMHLQNDLDSANDTILLLKLELADLKAENTSLKRELREKCGSSFWTGGRLHPLENQPLKESTQ